MKSLFFSTIMLFCIFAGSLAGAVEYNTTADRDPFASLLPSDLDVVTDSVPLPDLSMEGLVWGSERPTAIINGKVVRVGEEISGAKVVEINKEGVTVLFNGKMYEIKPQRNSNP